MTPRLTFLGAAGTVTGSLRDSIARELGWHVAVAADGQRIEI